MTTSQAFIPQWTAKLPLSRPLTTLLSVLVGAGLLSILAQIAIPLPFTPVPVTGQTFGVALLALLWGSRRGLLTMTTYLLLGAAGLPVFAASKSFVFGPTVGYLVGMLVASYVMGHLADRGWTKSFKKTWLAAWMGSLIVFAFGLLGLSFFVPNDSLLMMGFLPFIPGDLLKITLAAAIVSQSTKKLSPNE